MSNYATEEVFLQEVHNLDLLKEDVKIEEDQDSLDVIKEESEEVRRGPESFPLHPTETTVKSDDDGKFPCGVCGKKFRQRYRVKYHMVTHSEERHHKCNDCDYAAKSKGDLTSHIRKLHPTETPFQCQVCWKSFSTLSLLKQHSVSHDEKKLFKCDQCSTTYKNRSSLRNHRAKVHDGEGEFRCEVCGKKFLYRSKLNEHMVRHSKERNHKCPECGRAFKSKGDLSKHMGIVHPSNHKVEKPFQCNHCSEGFETLPLLTSHTLNHRSEESHQCPKCGQRFETSAKLHLHLHRHNFGCDKCDQQFKSRNTLAIHEHLIHSAPKPFECKVCSKRFQTPVTLRYHALVHSDENMFKCKSCPEAFKSRSRLCFHVTKVHKRGKRFKCNKCDSEFITYSDLSAHKHEAHYVDKPFKCEQCFWKFDHLSSLKQHSLTHSEDRAFRCEMCPKTFKSRRCIIQHMKIVHKTAKKIGLKASLDEHGTEDLKVEPIVICDPVEKRDVSNVDVEGRIPCQMCGKNVYLRYFKHHVKRHSNEKNHKCSECGSAFKAKGDLTKHINIFHPTETPFHCEVCSKSYATLPLLKAHSVKHTEEKTFKCDQCPDAFKWRMSLNNHKVLVHGGGGKFSCEVCGKKYLYEAHLKDHMLKHSDERNHKCSECGCAFKSKGDLTKHININHPTETPFRCEVCSKSYATLRLLSTHSSKHNEEKSFECDRCSEAFKLKRSLDNHKVAVHGGGGKFACEACGKKFLYRATLNEHLMRHGTGRDHECCECGRTFKTKGDLNQHMERHSNEKSHKCSECGCAFKSKWELYYHKSAKHPKETPFQCEVCLKSFSTLSFLRRHSVKHDETKPFEDVEVKVEPIVIYDPEERRDISNVKQELEEEEMKKEPDYMEEL